MMLSEKEFDKIYFLTRTSWSKKRIQNLAKVYNDIDELIEKVKKIKSPDLDRDWTLFDYEFKKNKILFAKNVKIIKEEDIFHGTYIHRCKKEKKFLKRYLIQIIGSSGFCRRCDTQFFPKLWWENPFKEKITYEEIKYGHKIYINTPEINNDYLNTLIKIGVDPRIIEETLNVLHSQYEIEKMLKTQFYDKKNPPPPSKIHFKLILLKNLWTIRPVRKLGIFPDSNYFFHKCTNMPKRILFREKNFYPWCPGCSTKFIPDWDKDTIQKYKKYFTVATFTDEALNNAQVKNNYITEKRIHKLSDEFFYLSILGLNDRSSITEVNETFRKLSKIYHPDFGGTSEMFQKIVKAKNWLLKFYKNLVNNNK